MLAINLGKLPVWADKSKRQNLTVPDYITVYSHQDAKLRGFGTAAKVIDADRSAVGLGRKYRLVCGRGIKNVHIWQFTAPDPEDDKQIPSWTCM